MSYLRAFFATLSLPTPLAQSFIHDHQTEYIKYTGSDWIPINVGSGDPYRNADLYLAAGSSDCIAELHFRSGGLYDEVVSIHGVTASQSNAQVLLNGIVVRDFGGANAESGNFWYDRSTFFNYPIFSLRPSAGSNIIQIRRPPSASGGDAARVYFDGFGLNVRGGPLLR